MVHYGPMTKVHVSLPPEDHDRLKAYAVARHRSVANMARVLIEVGLDTLDSDANDQAAGFERSGEA